MKCALCRENSMRQYPCARAKGEFRYICPNCVKMHTECGGGSKDFTKECGVGEKESKASKGWKGRMEVLKQGAVGFPKFTHRVEPGNHATVMATQGCVIGTRGCATCVGVIATLQKNQVFCAHMHHDVKGAAPKGIDEGEAWKATKVSLYNIFPPYDDVKEIYLTFTANNWVTELTVKAIREVYGVKAALEHINRADAVWWSDGKVSAGEGAGRPNEGKVVSDGRESFRIEKGMFILCRDQ